DLVAQGWDLNIGDNKAWARKTASGGETREATKLRVRAGHLLERNVLLREPSVAAFVTSVEQRRIGPSGWVSIFSLMRDGRELARKLESNIREPDGNERLTDLSGIVAPYLQPVESGAICQLTGLKLTEIWRYFRHTWSSTYK